MRFLFAALFILGLVWGAGEARAGDNSNVGVVRTSDIEYSGMTDWKDFEKFMKDREEQDRTNGLSYMISGGLATVGGMSGYYSSEETLSRGVYAIAQTVGIAALGYGASLYWNGNEYDSFYRSVRDSNLTNKQRNEILQRFLANEKAERERADWIRCGTHILLATVNFYSASREPNKDVKGIFQFLGAINAAMAISFAF